MWCRPRPSWPWAKAFRPGPETACDRCRGKEYKFVYDKLGRLLKETNPLGYATIYTYAPLGQVKTVQKPTGQIFQAGYDVLNRLTTITYPDQSQKTYTYDNGNRILSVTAAARQLQYEYDPLGRVKKATDAFGRAVTYEYDAVGNRTGLILPDLRKFAYQYDELNRLSAVVSPGGGTFGFQYDAASRRTGLTYPNGKVASYAFDELDRLTSMCNGVSNYTYQYDKTFNIKSLTGPGGLTTYNYDALYRLTEVVYPEGRQESFTYDELGNRLTRTTPEGTESYSYDDADELLSAGAKQFRYNQNGSLTEISDGTDLVQYIYDADEQLKQVLTNSQEIAAYDYDPFGRRIAGRNGSDERQYLWDGDALLSEYSPGGTLLSLYHNGDSFDEVLAIQDAATHYVHADHLGSIASVTGAAGSVELERSYDSFGQTLTSSRAFGTSLGYIGREMDASTGLIYLRARHYDPSIGRFTSTDPIRDGANWYSYCNGNPINFVDLNGLHPQWAQNMYWIPFLGWGMALEEGLQHAWQDVVETAGAYFHWEWTYGDSGDCHDWEAWRQRMCLASISTLSTGDLMVSLGITGTEAIGTYTFGLGQSRPPANPSPSPGSAAAPKPFSPDQSALVDLAKEAQRKGASPQDWDILSKWANEYGLPYRGPEVHPGRPFGQFPHYHLGPVQHIPQR